MAPERLHGEKYKWPSEVWGLGLNFYECAVGRYPLVPDLNKLNIFEMKEMIAKPVVVELPPGYNPELKRLLSSCLRHRPEERVDIRDLARDPWILQFQGAAAQKPLMEWLAAVAKGKRERADSLAEARTAPGSSS
jgi:serine/threonine protein kinase